MNMELDDYKTAWKHIRSPEQGETEIKNMILENNHPVLKKIRMQIIIEVTGWITFLFFYYTMFDGHTKPAAINLVLILSIITPLIHNFYGYGLAKNLNHSNTVKASLEEYIDRIKKYSNLSIFTRVIFFSGLMIFFTYGLDLSSQLFPLAGLLLIFIIQIGLLKRMWSKRIQKLVQVLKYLS